VCFCGNRQFSAATIAEAVVIHGNLCHIDDDNGNFLPIFFTKTTQKHFPKLPKLLRLLLDCGRGVPAKCNLTIAALFAKNLPLNRIPIFVRLRQV
jgi:hypothetical protein